MTIACRSKLLLGNLRCTTAISFLLELFLVCCAGKVLAAEMPGSNKTYRKVVMIVRTASECNAQLGGEDLQFAFETKFPRDLLLQKKLKLESLNHYSPKDMEDFIDFDYKTARRIDKIKGLMKRLDIAFSLFINASCPAGHLRLSGQALDQDMIDQLSICTKGQQIRNSEGREICNHSLSSYDAAFPGEYELVTNTIEGQRAALRILISKMFFPFSLEIRSDHNAYDPNNRIEQLFLLSPTHPRFIETPPKSLQVQYLAAEIAGDLAETVCRAPEASMILAECAIGHINEAGLCPPNQQEDALQVTYRRAEGTMPILAQRAAGTSLPVYGARLRFEAPLYTVPILIRAVAVDDAGALQSPVAYRCVDVQPRSYSIGTQVMFIWPRDAVARDPNTAFPNAAQTFAVNFRLLLLRRIPALAKRSRFLSTAYLGGELGFTKMQGRYPCPSGDLANCADPLEDYRPLQTGSDSITLELLAASRIDLIRFSKMSVRFIGNTGLGIEFLKSFDTPFRNDGTHGVFLAEIGLGLNYYGDFLAGSAASYQIGFIFQPRLRFSDTVTTATGNLYRDEAAGVSDRLFSFGISFETSIFPPRKSRQTAVDTGNCQGGQR